MAEETVWIECLTGFRDGVVPYNKGERVVESREKAEYFCANGWARDISGEIATGEAAVGSVDLDVQGSVHKVKGTENE